MLCVQAKNRATVEEILHHPWVLETFGSPPDLHVPPRLPLTVETIDDDVGPLRIAHGGARGAHAMWMLMRRGPPKLAASP